MATAASTFDLRVPVTKHTPEGKIFGWGYQTVNHAGEALTDHSGERVSRDELEKAFHDLATLSANGTDEQHQERVPARLITAVVLTPEIKAAIGTDEHGTNHLESFKAEGAFIGYHVDPAGDTFRKVASGELSMMSIVGTAEKRTVTKAKAGGGSEHTTDLVSLKVSRVGLVGEGDNPGARITLWKRAPRSPQRVIVEKLSAFGQWVRGQEETRSAAQSLSYASGIEAAALRAILSGERTPTEDEIKGIAIGLGEPVETVRAQVGAQPDTEPQPQPEEATKMDRQKLIAKAADLLKAKKLSQAEHVLLITAKALSADMTKLMYRLLEEGSLTADEHAGMMAAMGGGEMPAAAKPEDAGATEKARNEIVELSKKLEAVTTELAKAADVTKEREEIAKVAALPFVVGKHEEIAKRFARLRKSLGDEDADAILGELKAVGACVDTSKLFGQLGHSGEPTEKELSEAPADEQISHLVKARMAKDKIDYRAASALVEGERPDLVAKMFA